MRENEGIVFCTHCTFTLKTKCRTLANDPVRDKSSKIFLLGTNTANRPYQRLHLYIINEMLYICKRLRPAAGRANESMIKTKEP
jgi:hypothetical protein